MKTIKNKLEQRMIMSHGHRISVGLTGNIGYLSIEDTNLYRDNDSRADRRDLNFNTMMIPKETIKFQNID
jgi:hypothetical protein